MKQFKLTFLLTILMSMVGARASAYDIAVANDDGVTIYYNYINEGKELEVTYNSNSGHAYTSEVNIPEEVVYMNRKRKVTSIGSEAFHGCSSLTSITCHATIPPSCGPHVFGVDKSACILKVPEASIDLYKTASEWKDFSIIEATGIQDVKYGKIEGVKYYDLNGNQSSQARKGLNIVRMSNGKTKKVLVK